MISKESSQLSQSISLIQQVKICLSFVFLLVSQRFSSTVSSIQFSNSPIVFMEDRYSSSVIPSLKLDFFCYYFSQSMLSFYQIIIYLYILCSSPYKLQIVKPKFLIYLLFNVHVLCYLGSFFSIFSLSVQNIAYLFVFASLLFIQLFVLFNLNRLYGIMNPHKKQTVEKMIIEQSGEQILDLNDIVLGYDGARILGALIPEYHRNLKFIKLNGNNIDSQGFQFIFTGLMHCQYLKSIEAQWNSIGTSQVGLIALSQLILSNNNIEFINLKNNRISHYLSKYIAEIIKMNKKNLKVLDLRWNELGQLGAKQILSVLAYNRNIKFIGLEDNRISTGTLIQIQNILKNGVQVDPRLGRNSSHSQPNIQGQFFPISADSYPSMDVQLKTGELRTKIESQQKELNRYTEKVETQIQKILQKLKLKGVQIVQIQAKYDGIMIQNAKITTQLRETQRMLALEKERILGTETKNANEVSQLRNERYKLNNSIQGVMEKFHQRNQRELEQIDLVMGQKLDRLNAYYKQRLHQKRVNRQKLTQLKQDIVKYRLSIEQSSNKQLSSKHINNLKSAWQQQLYIIQEEIASTQTTGQNQMKKGEYMTKQLTSQIIKSLNKEQYLEKEIFQVQSKIKSIHHGMATKNLDIEKNIAELKLRQSEILDKQAVIDMENKYIKYLHSQGNIKVEVESMMQEEIIKGEQVSEEGVQMRIAEIQRALRAQQAQNRMIKNQYEKLMSQMENVAKKNIQLILFE